MSKEQDDGVIKAILESLKDVGELVDIEIIAHYLDADSQEVVYEAREAIRQIYSKQIRPTRIEKLRYFWRTTDKLSLFEIPIFIVVLLFGLYLWEWDLQKAAFVALLFTYFFGRLRTLKKPTKW